MPSLKLRRYAGAARDHARALADVSHMSPDPTENSAQKRPRTCTPYEIARRSGKCRELKTKDRLELYHSDSAVPCKIQPSCHAVHDNDSLVADIEKKSEDFDRSYAIADLTADYRWKRCPSTITE
jgi:hypothetical protein